MATVIAPGFSITAFLEQECEKDLLGFSTAGSVDDGKSTLIGRLLYDTQSVYEDQVRSIEGKGTTAPGILVSGAARGAPRSYLARILRPDCFRHDPARRCDHGAAIGARLVGGADCYVSDAGVWRDLKLNRALFLEWRVVLSRPFSLKSAKRTGTERRSKALKGEDQTNVPRGDGLFWRFSKL